MSMDIGSFHSGLNGNSDDSRRFAPGSLAVADSPAGQGRIVGRAARAVKASPPRRGFPAAQEKMVSPLPISASVA